MSSDEHGDPRYADGPDGEEHRPPPGSSRDDDRCLGGGPDDDSGWDQAGRMYGPDYVTSLMAVQDAVATEDALAALVPGLCHRWPEPRVLWQDEVWWTRDRVCLDLDYASPDDARWLLGALDGLLPVLHRAAARDEDALASTGLRTALASVGVPLIADTDPRAWLESTVLVRALRRIAAAPDRVGTDREAWPR